MHQFIKEVLLSKPMKQTEDEFFYPLGKKDGAEILRGKHQKDLEGGILCLGACWGSGPWSNLRKGLEVWHGCIKGLLDSFSDIFMLQQGWKVAELLQGHQDITSKTGDLHILGVSDFSQSHVLRPCKNSKTQKPKERRTPKITVYYTRKMGAYIRLS